MAYLRRINRFLCICTAVIAIVVGSGCGKKGPLYLDNKTQNTDPKTKVSPVKQETKKPTATQD